MPRRCAPFMWFAIAPVRHAGVTTTFFYGFCMDAVRFRGQPCTGNERSSLPASLHCICAAYIIIHQWKSYNLLDSKLGSSVFIQLPWILRSSATLAAVQHSAQRCNLLHCFALCVWPLWWRSLMQVYMSWSLVGFFIDNMVLYRELKISG